MYLRFQGFQGLDIHSCGSMKLKATSPIHNSPVIRHNKNRYWAPASQIITIIHRNALPHHFHFHWLAKNRPFLVGISFIRMLPARPCIYRCPNLRDRICDMPSNHPCIPREPTPNFRNHASYIEDGYSITLTDAPKDLGGRLRLNCARTTPELPGGDKLAFDVESLAKLNIPCGLVTLPQITLIFDPRTSLCAR